MVDDHEAVLEGTVAPAFQPFGRCAMGKTEHRLKVCHSFFIVAASILPESLEGFFACKTCKLGITIIAPGNTGIDITQAILSHQDVVRRLLYLLSDF